VRGKSIRRLLHIAGSEKCTEDKVLTKEAFYSELNDEDNSDEDYAHAQSVPYGTNLR